MSLTITAEWAADAHGIHFSEALALTELAQQHGGPAALDRWAAEADTWRHGTTYPSRALKIYTAARRDIRPNRFGAAPFGISHAKLRTGLSVDPFNPVFSTNRQAWEAADLEPIGMTLANPLPLLLDHNRHQVAGTITHGRIVDGELILYAQLDQAGQEALAFSDHAQVSWARESQARTVDERGVHRLRGCTVDEISLVAAAGTMGPTVRAEFTDQIPGNADPIDDLRRILVPTRGGEFTGGDVFELADAVRAAAQDRTRGVVEHLMLQRHRDGRIRNRYPVSPGALARAQAEVRAQAGMNRATG